MIMIIIRSCNQSVGLVKNGVLQVLSSWEKQTVLQCLKLHRKSVLYLIEFFWESKMETFHEATSKKTSFSLYLEKSKLFIQLFWLLSFTMVARNNTFSVEFLLPWKKKLEKSNVVNHELQVASYKLLVTSWKLKSTSWNSKVRFQVHESRVQIHEFKFTSY